MYQVIIHDLDKLVPYARNSRTHSTEQVAQIKAAMVEFGWTTPILADLQNGGIIVAGHGRRLAGLELRDAKVQVKLPNGEVLPFGEAPVIDCSGWSEAQRRAYIIWDNKSALNSGWDFEMLKVEFQELESADFDLSLTGFDPDELSDIMLNDGQPESSEDEEIAPDAQECHISKLGDIWLLGEKHRLICGDITQRETIDALLDGVEPDMVFADPPYGIEHTGNGSNGVVGKNQYGTILGDGDVTIAQGAFKLAQQLFGGKPMVFFGANYYPSVLDDGHGWLVWDKEREGDIYSGAEIAYVNVERMVRVFRHQWHGMIKASESGKARVHPTQKPVKLYQWIFEQYGKPQKLLDMFCGSGSAIMAGEEAGIVVYAAERDPKYCDVTIRRYIAEHGCDVINANTGEKFPVS